MEPVSSIAQLKDLGLGLLFFYMWYTENKKNLSHAKVIDQQVNIIEELRAEKLKEAEQSRQERAEFIAIVKENTAALQRNSDQLQQIRCIEKPDR